MTTSELSDSEVLQMILDSIVIPSEIVGNIVLSDAYSAGGYTSSASWRSTASSVITSSGVVTPNVSDRTATLVLTLTYREETLRHNFNVTVLGNEAFLVLYAVIHNLVEIPIDPVSEDLTLPSSYTIDDKTVLATWSSSNEEALTSNGAVHLTTQRQTVTLTLVLEYAGVERTDTFQVVLAQNPDSLPENWWHTVSVYSDAISGEVAKPSTPSCFSGAVYRKVVSSKDYWLGIETLITIPTFTPDPDRVDSTRPSYYLDNASIYLGGNAYNESDVGLTWSIGYDNDHSTAYSSIGIAFRPFWRYITSAESCTNNNCYRNAYVGDFEYYYFPGDTIRMSVYSPQPGYMQMRIELISETTDPDYANKRAEYGLLGDFNHVFVTPMFPSSGMGAAKAEFKRVNAIDQVANEGKATINTNSTVENAIWHEVYLYRMIDNILYRVPMTSSRTASMTCPLGSNVNGDFSNAFTITYDGVDSFLGGEVVSLHPNNGTGRLYNIAIILPKREEIVEV